VLLAGLAATGAYFVAGWMTGPILQVESPTKYVGQATDLRFTAEAPGSRFSQIDAVLEQKGKQFPLFSLRDPQNPDSAAAGVIQQESESRLRVTRPMGKRAIPELQPGPARLTILAARPVMFGLRTLETTLTRDLELRFDPPRLSVASTHHFVNHGGTEMIVYRVSPPDVESGVRVGDLAYKGYPASGIGTPGADPSLKVAFFALSHDQDLNTRMELFAVDQAGNERRVPFDHQVFPKPFRRSRIEIDDAFLERVVPAILENTPDFAEKADTDLIAAYLKINNELRQRNAATIEAFAKQTAPTALWQGAFQQLSNSQVESAFADQRTYFYNDREIDRQVHLGFDLAVTAAVPIRAANRGKVLYADYLGIYGNCVILDHGMGVQSLYGHLSSVEVAAGDMVERNQVLGRSGATGLAGGDHLHFTMLVGGRAVNPVEWWDAHWIEDRVMRKIREAGGAAPTATTKTP
jgi:murein DD-endopeptidase MepM/ murein hydrolase activator NlpD